MIPKLLRMRRKRVNILRYFRLSPETRDGCFEKSIFGSSPPASRPPVRRWNYVLTNRFKNINLRSPFYYTFRYSMHATHSSGE